MMKDFDVCAIKFERKMQGLEAKYERKMEAWFWERVNDFIKQMMWYRKLDAINTKKFRDYGNGDRNAFHRRMVNSTLERVTKNRFFIKYVDYEKGLTLFIILRQMGWELK